MRYVYGIHAVDALLRKRPRSIVQLWLARGRDDSRIANLEELARNQGVPVSRASRSELADRVTGRHQGAVAEVSRVDAADEDASNLWSEAQLHERLAAKSTPAFLLVLDGVTDPHNLGACLRSADAAGVDAVIVPRDRAAGITPTVSKVACGAAQTVPFVQVTNLRRTLETLKSAGIWAYGAAGEAEDLLYDCDLTTSLAVVLGAEGSGLRRLTREQCDALVKLPMAGDVSSLNVSVATGITLFEVVRQRRSA